ncbi:MAG: hypothetical protein VXW65_07075 [Pseudomonadota bacterium]|nr:hypothetical protein [Pseudomonadota bacterium]
MRTLIIIICGMLCVGLLAGVSRLLRDSLNPPWLLYGSIGVWLLFSLWNLRVGMSHGYTLLQELPFLLLNFGVPVLFALWLHTRHHAA